MDIRKLTNEYLCEILRLNSKYNKEYHSNKQKFLFENNSHESNCSYGIFVNDLLVEYLVAFKNETSSCVIIENFIWKNSKGYVELMKTLFKNNDCKYDMYICDKGLNVFLKIIDRYFSCEYCFHIEQQVKEERYGEVLNHIYFTIHKI